MDGVTAAVLLIETLVRLGLTTSKLGGYALPLPKRIAGSPRREEGITFR